MLKFGWTFFLLIGTFEQVIGASHLDYHYFLDAVVYERTTPEGTTVLHFQAVQHPHWGEHEDSLLLKQLNSLCGHGVNAMGFGEETVKAALPAVEITDPMNERQIVEMLLARAGIMDFDPQKDRYSTDMHFYSIQFPDHRYPAFNLEYSHVMRAAGQKEPAAHKRWSTMKWNSAKALTISDYGSDKVIKCVKEGVKAEAYKWKDIVSDDWVDDWMKSVDCATPVARVNSEEIFFLPVEVQEEASAGTGPSDLMISVKTSCFLGDPPCEN